VTLRVVVVGPGAVGSFLGASLARAGHDVTLLGRRAAGPDEVRLVEAGGSHAIPVHRRAASDGDPDGGAPDLVVLAVKLFDLPEALATAARWPDAPRLTVQNGVGAEALAVDAGAGPVLAGSLTTAVQPVEDGVRRLRTGGLGLAAVRDVDAAWMGELAEAFAAGGLPARVYPDAVAMKWSKLVANLVGNASSAILDLDPGAIYADPASFDVERRQLLEARGVMAGLGARPVDLPGAPVRPLLLGVRLPAFLGRPVLARAIGGARGGKSPSLRLHVRGDGPARPAQPGPTEVRWLNGAVAREAARLGLAAPVNARLEALVEEVAGDRARAAWFAGRPERLRQAVDRPA
jgi:2-dehydropantoate 2-reductase